MNAIILACSPAECEKIVNGDMSILVRKKVPKETPFKVYIYCAKSDKYLLDRDSDGSMFCWDKKSHHYPFKYEKDHEELFNGKVIGSFVCDEVDKWECKNRLEILESFPIWRASYMLFVDDLEKTCLTYDDLWDYGNGKPLYGWHISDLKIYDKPKELSEFRACNFKSMNGTDVCGNYDCKYYQDSGSYMIPPSCAKNGCRVTRPPQNYIYVEEQENSNE